MTPYVVLGELTHIYVSHLACGYCRYPALFIADKHTGYEVWLLLLAEDHWRKPTFQVHVRPTADGLIASNHV